jgi:hypothetical protein
MADYTSATEIDNLAGTLGVDLRTDDGVEATLAQAAVDFARGQIDFACQGRFSGLDQIQWVRNCATYLALEEYLCLRRLNSPPASLVASCDRFREQLLQVQEGRAVIPGATRSRRQVALSTPVVDLQRHNNQSRIDTTRSTGVARGYVRPTDPKAPDQR